MKIKILVSILAVLVYSCASSVRYSGSTDEFEYESTIKLDVNKIYCWINKMPGSSERFNITGDVLIKESPGYKKENVSLKNIKIIQNNKEVLFIKPIVRIDENTGSIQFSTVNGLSLNDLIDIDKNVDVYLIFEEDDDIFTYLFKNCKIDRVY